MRTENDLSTALQSLAGEPDPGPMLGRIQRAARRRRARTAAVAAAAAVVLAAGGVLIAQLSPAHTPDAGAGQTRPATAGLPSGPVVRAAILTAIQSAGDDILYVRSSGAYYRQMWIWPAIPAARQLEHTVSAETLPGAGTRLSYVVYSAYRMSASGRQIGSCAWLSMDYSSRTYERLQKKDCAADGPPGSWATQFTQSVAAGEYTVVGRVTLGGQPAIELRVFEHGIHARLWVNAVTYLPLASQTKLPGDKTAERQTFELFSPSAANLRTVPDKIPAGFRPGS